MDASCAASGIARSTKASGRGVMMPISPENTGPRLTVGMPLYNNARTIRQALDSLVGQTYSSFRILISDDGSSDATADICEEYAARDSRIEVVRQPRNLNYGNFRYVLEHATTPLFMFAAGDDYWHSEYVARMIEALDANPGAVCAVSKVAFVRDGVSADQAPGTRALTADPVTNIVSFLAAGDDNSRMYGVFRTAPAQRAFPRGDFHAYDWAFSVGTLREGTHIEVPEVLMWRERTDPHRYTEYVRRDARNPLARWFPMLPLTWDLLGRLRIPVSYALARQLFWLNANFHLGYLRRYHPTAAALSERVVNGLARIARAIKGASASW
jgi:glycosyltransferase involved in cell wall biosynthesis